jgi:hypothetical protein
MADAEHATDGERLDEALKQIRRVTIDEGSIRAHVMRPADVLGVTSGVSTPSARRPPPGMWRVRGRRSSSASSVVLVNSPIGSAAQSLFTIVYDAFQDNIVARRPPPRQACDAPQDRGTRRGSQVRRHSGDRESGAVVERDLVAIRVGEGECPTEGAVDRSRDDGVTVGDKSMVNGLNVCGVEPDSGSDAGLSYGCEIGAGNDVATANAIGLVSKTTACGGPAGERTRPRYFS